MTTKISVPVVLLLLLFSTGAFADDRQAHAKTVREMVWAWDKPEFKQYELPAGYENESAVILARHQHIEATSKNRFRMNALLFGDINRELYYTNIDRRMVKINGLSALTEFSELSFREETKMSGHMRSNRLRTIVGARVIKPDGSTIEVAVDEEAVAMTEGKKEKEMLKKVAIPGLQVGDILDYFVCDEMELETYNVPPEIFAFFGQYPVLKYSIHCEFGNKLTVEYRSVNGAPEMRQTIDADNNYILDTEAENLMKVRALDDTRWISPYRSLPMIRMYVLNNASKLIFKSPNARAGGVYENLPYDEYLNDSKTFLAAQEKQMFWMKEIDKKVKKTVLAYKDKHPSMSDDELAVLLYDALRFHWPNDYANYPRLKFVVRLQQLFKEHDVPHKLLFVTSRFGPGKDAVVSDDDIFAGLLANDRQLFFFVNGYRYAGEIPPPYQGEAASTVEVVKYAMNKKYGIEGSAGQYEIPESKAGDNRLNSKIEVSFPVDNPLQLNVKRDLKCTGSMKEDYWPLVIYEDWDREMREKLGIGQTLMEELQENKSTRKRVDEYVSALENRRENQKENVELELTAYHGQKPDKITDYSLNAIGVTADRPALDYTVSYTLDGLVKSAGSNLILEIGRLIGQHWEPDELDEKRNIEAYLPTAMRLDYEIEIAIPEGYAVEELDALTSAYSNDCGGFQSGYKLEGNRLVVTVNKLYEKSYVPVDKWGEMLLIAKRTNDFQAKTIILKKL
ncbi:DUF3857 domain-containing protein [Proteiniphilum sp. X52]|uniref:DUF3857 domain-containing protein n=1 Tax=Proteiniphilum sp. X52 TaxID=2382159 RepID=UPI000F09F0A8|nr:DUF3857 domain-containing protein [Proteiniphilum sp. X52]RNC66792.1 DUF3857 domain-containing protein [Proteiniphilum sp. X52]